MPPSDAAGGTSGSSFLGRFSKGLDISSMKEKTRAALDMSSMKQKTKAASASLSGKMNSLGSSLMSDIRLTAKKDDKKTEDVSLRQPAPGGAPVSSAPAPKRTPGQLRCM